MAKMSFVGGCDIAGMLKAEEERDGGIGPDVAIVIEFDSKEECVRALGDGFVKFSLTGEPS